jgi:aminoglycoside phosphotransferase family enzyme/predicted kinase
MTKLPEMIQALLEPRAYPDLTGKVKLVQTQMSFVFLTDSYVYKVKKPVNLGYLDYTTLEKRKFYCQKEVELNRRLCPDIYLDVVPVTRHQGDFFIAGQGKAIEYAVKMRRLPQELMMDTLLASNQVSSEMITKLAQKLATFHEQAETNKRISIFGSLDTISQNTNENFSQTEKYIGKTTSSKNYRHIKAYTDNFLKENAPLFRKRIKDGRIKDCHGDLHAAHICFTNGICIYDCIEFNDRFRYADVASEVAFLAMDLDHYGRADLSRLFVSSYISLSRDRELLEMLTFYKCYRAYVRGKVESFKLDDPYITEEEREETLKKASGYFDLAFSYVKLAPSLLITAGLVGSGKSALAQALAKRLGLVVISSDVTRKRLASIPETEHRFEEFDVGIYSPEFSRKTYNTMLSEAESILREGGSAIIDASFIKAEERLKAKRLAQELNTNFFVLECTLDEELTRKRLIERLKQGSVSDGRWEIFSQQRERFEPVVEVPPQNRVIIDSSQPIDRIVRQVLDIINKGVDDDKPK